MGPPSMPVRCNAYGATLTIAGEIDSIASGLFKAKSTGLRNKIRKVSAMKILLDVSVILIPLAIIVAGILYRHWMQRNTTNSFYVANRDVGTFMVAISLASAWIWTVALFIVPQKIYELGIIAALPLVFVNAACILLLGVLVPRVRKICGDTQMTLPQFAAIRDGKRTEGVLTAGVLGVQIYSVITHMLGASLLLQFMSHGLDKPALFLLLAGAFLFVAATRGLQSSIVADIVKYTAIGGVVLLALIATDISGGLPALAGGATGLRTLEAGFVDLKTLWQFVIPVSAALLSAVAMDDQLYQRGFAARSRPGRSYMLGAFFFLLIVLGMGLLGLLAANKALGNQIDNVQLVNFLTIKHLLPNFPMYLVVTAFMTSLIASGGAALHAAGNVGAKNVVQILRPDLHDRYLVLVSRATMLVTLIIGTLAALANVGIFELWIGWGMFRAVLFFPIIALITMRREAVPSVFWWIVVGLVTTLASFAMFRWLGDSIPAASGEAILVAWGTTLAVWMMRLARNAWSVQAKTA